MNEPIIHLQEVNGTAGEPFRIDLMIESTGGGSMRHVMDLHDTLVERGHDLRLIVSLKRAELGVKNWISGIDPRRIIRADTSRAPHPADFTLIRRLRNRLKGETPRLLHAHSTKAGILASFLKDYTAGTILTPHAYRGMDPTLRPMKKKFIEIAERVYSRNVSHVIAVSPDELDYAQKLGVPNSRSSYIANGIDIAAVRLRAEAGRPLTCAKDAPPVVGFVGRMTHQKNPLLFLDAFALLHAARPELRGIMIGDGELLEQVKAHRDALGLTAVVDLLGALDFGREMHRMAILLHTSLYESLPYVLLEAGAGGVAIVSVRNAGSEAVLPDSVLTERSASALAAATLPMLDEPIALKNARHISQSSAARFSIATMADRTEAIYRRVLSEANGWR